MNIFQRLVTFEGPPQEVVPWAMEVTECVNERTEFDVSLWQGAFGGPIGTLAWSSLIPSLSVLESQMDKLGADEEYLQLVSRAQDWVSTPGEDYLVRVAHVAGGEYSRPDVGAYAEVTRAVPAEGKLAKAGEFGVRISDLHAELTHCSVLFGPSSYGAFGEVGWIAIYDNAAAVDEAAEAIAKDADYTKEIDAAGDLFQPGTGQRTLARRIA